MESHFCRFLQIALLSLALMSLGPPANAVEESLTLDALFELARVSHPFIKSEDKSPEIAKAERDRLDGQRDWVASASVTGQYEEPILTGQAGEAWRGRYALFSSSLNKAYWESGSRLTLAYDTSRLDSELTPAAVGEFRQYRNRFSAQYSLPLRRNARGILDRLERDLAEYDINIAALQSDENKESFLLDLGATFIDWALSSEQIHIFGKRLEIAQDELSDVKQRRADNLVKEVDVLRAKDAERIAMQNMVRANANYRARCMELAVLLDDETILTKAPQYDLYEIESLAPPQAISTRLKEQSRLLKSLEVLLAQTTHRQTALKNGLKSDLSLVASAAMQNGEAAWNDSVEADKPDVSIAAVWSRPIGNHSARSDLRKAGLQAEKIEYQVKAVERNLRASSLAIVEEMTEMAKLLDLNREQIESAKQRSNEEQKLYYQGRGELNFVLLARDNEANAALLYAQNAAFYQHLRIRLRELLDELL